MKTFTILATAMKPCITSFEIEAENESDAIKKASEIETSEIDWEFSLRSEDIDPDSVSFEVIEE